MNAGLSIVLLMVVVTVGIIAFAVYMWGRIFVKAGYSRWRGLLMLIPIVNFIVLILFAFEEWPIQRNGQIPPSKPPQAL